MLILSLLFFLPLGLTLSPSLQAQGISARGATWEDYETGEGEARGKFQNVYQSIKGFAGILLLIASAFAVIFFVMGDTKKAMLIFIGGIILYGMAYVLGMIYGAFQ